MWKKIKEFISKLNKNNRFIILTFIACFIFGLYLNSYSANIKQQEVPQEVSYVEFLEMVDEGKVKAVALDLKNLYSASRIMKTVLLYPKSKNGRF